MVGKWMNGRVTGWLVMLVYVLVLVFIYFRRCHMMSLCWTYCCSFVAFPVYVCLTAWPLDFHDRG